MKKNTQDLHITFSVDRSPEEVTKAIGQVRGWWPGTFEGNADQVGDEFTYRYEDIHYSTQRVVTLEPGKRVEWLVLNSRLTFIKRQDEWNDTRIVFDLVKTVKGTEVRFTHVGLNAEHECYDACSSGWGSCMRNLEKFIATGMKKATPTFDEGSAKSKGALAAG